MANALMTALAKAQLEFAPIVKNRTNYNKGTYADLTAILEAVKPALLEHGVVILQSPVTRYLENNLFVVDIVTTICHGESGETFEGILSMPAKNDAQAIGSAITYGRRYALVSMLSLSTEDDDDGEEAIKPAQKATPPQRQTQQPPAQATHRQPAPPPPANGSGSDKAERLFAKLRRLQADSKKEASQPMYAFASGIINRLTDDSHTAFFEHICNKPIANEDRQRIGYDLAKYIIEYASDSPSKEDKEKGLTTNPKYSVDVVEAIKAIHEMLTVTA
jgi:hypothetical protein